MCDRLLTVAEAALALNLKPRTLYQAVERRAVPHLRVGRLVRLDLAEVRAALRVERER